MLQHGQLTLSVSLILMQHVKLVDVLVYLSPYMYQRFVSHLHHHVLLCDSLIRSRRSRRISNVLFTFRTIHTITDGLHI